MTATIPVTYNPNQVIASENPQFDRDPLLYGANGGVLFACDMGFPFCRPLGNPTDGQAVKDISGRPWTSLIAGHADGSMSVATTAATFDSDTNGIDFTGAAQGNTINIPAEVAAAYAAGNQYFMACLYVTLPSEANWNSTTTAYPFLSWGTASNGYVSGPEVVHMFQRTNAGTKQIVGFRQTALNTVQSIPINTVSGDYGVLNQICYWRDAAGYNMRIKNAGRSLVTSVAGAGSLNAVSGLAAAVGKIGIGNVLWGSGTPGNTKNWQAHRFFFEDLEISGRDPATVLDADWTRNAARFA
jgi:hypothetical protein